MTEEEKKVTLCNDCLIDGHWSKYHTDFHYVILDDERCECPCHRKK